MDLNLAVVLPQLLAPAIAWAEEQARIVEHEGELLDLAGLALAKKVGVRHPDRIRTKIVDALPLPTELALRQAALATGLLGPTALGLTLGYGIIIVRGSMTTRLLSHECRHVYQYESYGSIAAFLPAYLQQVATIGYFDATFEQDARSHEIELG